MKKYVIIPQRDIDNLEKARRKLFELAYKGIEPRLIFGITDKIYLVTHRKYPTFKMENTQ